jgi:hypothetical protein
LLFAALQANGIEHLAKPFVAAYTEAYYPMFMKLRVGEVIGLSGKSHYDPLYTNLTGARFSLDVVPNQLTTSAAWESFFSAETHGMDGLAHKYVDVNGANLLCGFDRDCLLLMAGSTSNGTLNPCVSGVDYCDPVAIDGIKFDVLPLGSFYDRVELSWNYHDYRKEGIVLRMFDSYLGVHLDMQNAGADVQMWNEMWTWKLFNFPRRSEQCRATAKGFWADVVSGSGDSHGFDCDSSEKFMYAGHGDVFEGAAFILPFYFSMRSEPADVDVCTKSLECRVPRHRDFQVLVEPTFGHVLCSSFGVQINVRTSYIDSSVAFPSGKDTMIPILYNRRSRCLNEFHYRADFDELQQRFEHSPKIIAGCCAALAGYLLGSAYSFFVGCGKPLPQLSDYYNDE